MVHSTIRPLPWRPQDLDDRVHDTFLIVVQAIKRGELREPERLMGFVRTVVRRQVAAQIEREMQNRRAHLKLRGWRLKEEKLHRILIDNPRRFLAFVPKRARP